jgi:hypothetical protein
MFFLFSVVRGTVGMAMYDFVRMHFFARIINIKAAAATQNNLFTTHPLHNH